MDPSQLMGRFRFLGTLYEADVCYALVSHNLTPEEKVAVLIYLGLPVPIELYEQAMRSSIFTKIKASITGLDKLSQVRY